MGDTYCGGSSIMGDTCCTKSSIASDTYFQHFPDLWKTLFFNMGLHQLYELFL